MIHAVPRVGSFGTVAGYVVFCATSAVAAAANGAEATRGIAEAERWFLAGEWDRAAESFAAIPEESSEFARACEGRVRALIGAQRWREALDVASRAIGSGDGPCKGALGQALFRAGRIEEAETVLRRVADGTAASAAAVATLARIERARGRPEPAWALAARSLELDSDDPDVLFWSAELAGTSGQSVELLRTYLERYQDRDAERSEAARGTLRVYGALGDRSVWRRVVAPDRSEIPLQMIWDGTGRRLGYVVKARVGPSAERARPIRLLFDTGSGGLFVLDRLARKRGFERLANETVFGGGGDGKHESRRGLFPSVGIGEIEYEDALATTTRQELEPHGRYHGLIGLSVLDGYRVTLNLADERLLLESVPQPGGEDAEPMGIPYWTVAGQMLVQAEGRGGPGLYLFDTGAPSTLVSLASVDGVQGIELGEATAVRGFGGQVSGARVARGARIQFEGLSRGPGAFAALDLTTRSRLTGVEISGYLGLDLLEGAVFRIDTTSRRISVELPVRKAELSAPRVAAAPRSAPASADPDARLP